MREALGIRVTEYRPLRRDERITLSDGAHGTVWSETVQGVGAETVVAYTHGSLSGSPALTRYGYGTGEGWYLSTRLDDEDYAALIARLLGSAGVGPVLPGLPPGVEAVIRQGSDGRRWLIVLNHLTESVALPAAAHDLLTGGPVQELPPGGCAVLRGGTPL